MQLMTSGNWHGLQWCRSTQTVRCRARGFTLIEFTIVLAIAFILIGGALKLTSMLDEAKANDVIAIAGDLSEAARLFKERYKAFPGDMPNATALIPGVYPNSNGDGDGVIGSPEDPAESNNATNHLFQAEFIRRAPGGPIQSRFGDVWIMGAALATDGANSPCRAAIDDTAGPLARNVIVFSRLTAEAALEVDTKLDDGRWNTGRIRASQDFVGGDPKRQIPCFAMPL
jgi:prepilin-type N-terminal cleavage/methylation domain-containing protein